MKNPLAALDLGKKLGPLPRGVWIVGLGGGIGVVLLLRKRKSPDEAMATMAGDPNGMESATGYPGGALGGSPQAVFNPITDGTGTPGAPGPPGPPGPPGVDYSGFTFPDTPPAAPGAEATSPTVNIFLPEQPAGRPAQAPRPSPVKKKRTRAQIAADMSQAHRDAIKARMLAERRKASARTNLGGPPPRANAATHKAPPKAKAKAAKPKAKR